MNVFMLKKHSDLKYCTKFTVLTEIMCVSLCKMLSNLHLQEIKFELNKHAVLLRVYITLREIRNARYCNGAKSICQN